ncbi:TIGR01459 family HAD-type hydrolase [Hansschlegelia plantiphila]|uniref:Haloacid dehalogenase n=1 Tax=Hansschlegelia plantiphila TaxID=374655 RepID=A0A9W6MUS4_9HYPH|nr:TIGR01459 family HAD-type hydrolase [Hansschlegelia plantiphila]GLK67689.1 haloacid dehalogenase [Hansschlegelia plantiphila]
MSDSSPVFARFAPLAAAYDVALCDVWGVLHDGVHAHQEAGDALTRFRAGGGVVILVSNAPKPSEWVIEHLDERGVPRSAWDAVVTSGDVARHMLAVRDCWTVHHIGPDRDLPLMGDSRLKLVGPDEAPIVVVTGLIDDQTETPEDYSDRLAALKERRLPMICANPDLVVQVGEQKLWCAGAIADLYQTMGGETLFAGKPYAPIYDAAMRMAEEILDRKLDRSRAIAIGDAVRTDLAGATAAGVDCVFVADGIHGEELGRGSPDPEKLAALFAEHGYAPVAVMPRLVW